MNQQMKHQMVQPYSKNEKDFIIYTYDTTRIEMEKKNDSIDLSLSQGEINLSSAHYNMVKPCY